MDYKNAGVDIEAGYESVELMKKYVKGNHASGSVRRTWWIFRCFFHGSNQGNGGAGTFIWYRRMWNKSKIGISFGQA